MLSQIASRTCWRCRTFLTLSYKCIRELVASGVVEFMNAAVTTFVCTNPNSEPWSAERGVADLIEARYLEFVS